MSEFYTPTEADKEKFKDLSIVIASPHASYDSLNIWNKHVVNMVAYSWMNDLKIYQMIDTERMVCHWARNELCRVIQNNVSPYTGKKYTHILWLDDDHVFNPDLACYLARYADRDMVSALYYGRVGRILPVCYTRDGHTEKDDAYKHFPIVEPPESIFECDAVGFGALLMRVDVLDRVPPQPFQFHSAGEDIYFCANARKCGVRIWCDGSYRIGHVSNPKIVTQKDYKQYMDENAEAMTEVRLIALNTK